MAVNILEAIKCEKGDAGYNGSKPGDQLQKSKEGAEDFVGEVRMSEYRKFEKDGKYKIFRIKDETQRKSFVQSAYFFVNSKKVGYSQPNRLTLFNKVKSMGYSHYKELNKDVECDCSSLMYTCAQIAGIKNWKNWTTSDMMSKLSTVPELEELTDKKYFSSSDYLIEGDVLVKNGHTGCIWGFGSKVDPALEPSPEPPTPTPKPDQKVVPAPCKDTSLAGKYKTTTALNMRYGPSSANYEIEKVLPKNARLTCYGYTNSQKTWLLVIDNLGCTGWCALKYLSRIT